MSPAPASALCTIVVVPRERFGVAAVSLDSLLRETPPGYELIYVDAGSPDHVRRQIADRARRHGFKLLRVEATLSPAQAHNIGWRESNRPYVVFLDNDVLLRPGWLEALVGCAEQTGAGVVGPVAMQGPFELDTIHSVGGLLMAEPRAGGAWIEDLHLHSQARYTQLAPELARRPVDFIEFHGFLARRDLLERIGGFDETIPGAPDHIDFSLSCRRAGATLMLEPGAVISFLQPYDIDFADLGAMLVQWAPQRNALAIERLACKWNWHRASPFLRWQRQWMDSVTTVYHVVKQKDDIAWLTVPRATAPLAETEADLRECLRAESYDDTAIETVEGALVLARDLLGDVSRPTGKPWLVHGVQCASVLAAYRQPASILAAALLRAAYIGARRPAGVAINAAHRGWMRERLGVELEKLLWQCRAIAGWRAAPDDEEFLRRLPAQTGVAIALEGAALIADSDDGVVHAGWRARAMAWVPAYCFAARTLHLPGLAQSIEAPSERLAGRAAGEASTSPHGYRIDSSSGARADLWPLADAGENGA